MDDDAARALTGPHYHHRMVEYGKVELTGTVPMRRLEPMPSDSDIELRVLNTLTWNPDINTTDINANVEAGVVTLAGSVDAFWKKLLAADLVRKVEGVLLVENNLAVTPTDTFVDESIAKDVIAALSRDYAVDPAQINVKVENGYVILNGAVPGGYAKEAAYRAALNTPGVIGVEDNLLIRY